MTDFTAAPPGPAPAATGIVADPPPRMMTPFAPVAGSERLASIDFVRGAALLGIILVNGLCFFGPFADLMSPSLFSRIGPADRVVVLLVMSLAASKFISLFSLLFGFGLVGQIERAAERAGSPVWFTARRLLALLLFGVVHATLLWYGDILTLYALLGGWLLLARYGSARVLVVVAVALLLLTVGLRFGLGVLMKEEGGPSSAKAAEKKKPSDGPPPRGWDAVVAAGGNPDSPVYIEAETVAFRDGPWSDAMVFRLVNWAFVLISAPFISGWQILGMFLMGAALYKLRFFSPERTGLRRAVLMWCLPLGLAVEGAAAAIYWTQPAANNWAWVIAGTIQQAALLFLPLGYLAGLALLAGAVPGWVRGPVCSAGRMSLTVYLLETVIATGIAYYWGLGLFGRLSPAQYVPLCAGIWLVLVVFAHLWLSAFSQGPMEWLWRKLAYGRPAATPALADASAPSPGW